MTSYRNKPPIWSGSYYIPFISVYPFGFSKYLGELYMYTFPTWLFSGIITAPFKRMKVIKQLNSSLVAQGAVGDSFHSYLEIADFIYKREGIWGFYRGSVLDSIGTFPKLLTLILSITLGKRYPPAKEFFMITLPMTIQAYSELLIVAYPVTGINQEGVIEKSSVISIIADRINRYGLLSFFSGYLFNMIGIVFQCCTEYLTTGFCLKALGISGDFIFSGYALLIILMCNLAGEFVGYPFETISRTMIAFPEKKHEGICYVSDEM